MVEIDELKKRIREGIEGTEVVEIEDLTGTKDHFQAVVVSSTFEGLNRVKQHQAVYRALGELMAGPVHALALSTHTPEQWAQKNES